MAATVAVQEANGASITYSTITAARFCCADSYNPALTYPIPIPSGGVGSYAYSWWKHFCLDLSGTFTQINNVKLYSDGAIGWTYGTGGAILIAIRDSGDNGCPAASYQQAAGSADTGYYIKDATNGHAYYKTQTADPASIENYTSGSPLQIDTTDYTAAGKTKLAVMQLKVDGDATLGEQADETITWQYDEI